MGQPNKDLINSSIKLPSQVILHGSKMNFYFLNITLLYNYFYYFYLCVYVCGHMSECCMCADAQGNQKRVAEPLELKLQEAVSCQIQERGVSTPDL